MMMYMYYNDIVFLPEERIKRTEIKISVHTYRKRIALETDFRLIILYFASQPL